MLTATEFGPREWLSMDREESVILSCSVIRHGETGAGQQDAGLRIRATAWGVREGAAKSMKEGALEGEVPHGCLPYPLKQT